MHSPGLNRPSQVSHSPVCHYLLQVSPNPGLTFVTAESDQYLWISTLSFLPGYRRSTRNITVSFYWDDGSLLGYSLALPLALWLLCSCGAFRDSFLHLHHLQSSLCSLRFLSPEGILCLSLPSQRGTAIFRTFRNDSPYHCCGAGIIQNRCESEALTKQICGLC